MELIEAALGIVPDERHELGCVKRYGATETGFPDTDEQAAKCACHRRAPLQTEGE